MANDVESILHEWLRENGYDGLHTADGRCVCLLGELIPCESDPSACIPGYSSYNEFTGCVDMTTSRRRKDV